MRASTNTRMRRTKGKERVRELDGAGVNAREQRGDTCEKNTTTTKSRSCAADSPSLFLLVIHVPIPCASGECEQDSGRIRARDIEIEHEHGEQDGQHLFDIRYQQKGSGISSPKKTEEVIGGVKHTCDSHTQGSRLLIRGETDDVEPKSDTAVGD